MKKTIKIFSIITMLVVSGMTLQGFAASDYETLYEGEDSETCNEAKQKASQKANEYKKNDWELVQYAIELEYNNWIVRAIKEMSDLSKGLHDCSFNYNQCGEGNQENEVYAYEEGENEGEFVREVIDDGDEIEKVAGIIIKIALIVLVVGVIVVTGGGGGGGGGGIECDLNPASSPLYCPA